MFVRARAVERAKDMYAPTTANPVRPGRCVFVMGMGLLVLGIPVAALSTTGGGRDFFRGKTLNAGTEITVLDADPARSR